MKWSLPPNGPMRYRISTMGSGSTKTKRQVFPVVEETIKITYDEKGKELSRERIDFKLGDEIQPETFYGERE